MSSKADERTLRELKREIKMSAGRGYPLLLAGAIVFSVIAILSGFLSDRALHLAWVLGSGTVFPLGVVLGRLLGADVISKGNPLATLGGLVGGVQAAFIPVLVMVYQSNPQWLPFTLGLLAGGHFLPYVWIYDSRGYLLLSIAMPLFSLIAGGFFIETAFVTVPIGIAVIFLIAAVVLVSENRKDQLAS